MTTRGDVLKCSFCGKTKQQVIKLIAGPGVYICDQCIDLCNKIMVDEVGNGTFGAEIEAAAKNAREAIERLRFLAQRPRDEGPE